MSDPNESNDEDFHSLDEDEYYDEEFPDSNIERFLDAETKIQRKKYSIYFFKDGIKFIKSIQPWTYNQPLKKSHIKKIKMELEREPFLMGVFTVIQLDNDRLFLIDGHHRTEALRQLDQEGFERKIEIQVHCYQGDTIDSQSTSGLFHKINNTKPFKMGPLVTDVVIRIINYLEVNYPKAIKNGSTRSQCPYIHKKSLNDVLYQTLSEMDSINYNRIIRKITDTNHKYRHKAKEIIKKAKKSWDIIQPRLEKTKFYPGVLPLEKWIEEITR